MAIAALSEETVRLLGSHTVIATPVDLVKELLDNSIDSKAASIDILVSPDLVDKIVVRDDGHGIHPDSYKFLGCAGHTSKITSFEDLHTLGGTTLGFRGQALASANNLGTVTVTTRTDKDPTAVELKLSPGGGGVESQRRTSAPVGTTVSVTGLYSRLPVRKQAAVKDAPKNLVKVKRLMYTYALARPQIRLSFRTLGGKHKQTFSYSPGPVAGVKEAIIQVFGIEVASQCLVRTVCSGAGSESDEVSEDIKRLSIEAVVPKPDADQSRIAKGPFFSVDSRPVSAKRETMKKLHSMFKAYFSDILKTTYGEKAFRDAFVCVNIICPPGSYDPNIEPSKDVVLFADESQVTQLFQRLCSDVYRSQNNLNPFDSVGKQQLFQGTQTQTPPTSSDGPGHEDTHDMATKLYQITGHSNSNPVNERPKRIIPRRQPALAKIGGGEFMVNMSADLGMSSDEEAETIASQLRHHQTVPQAWEEDELLKGALNPWTIAQMNAPNRQSFKAQSLPEEYPQHAGQLQEHSEVAVVNETSEHLPLLRSFREAPGDLDISHTTCAGITPTTRHHFDLPGLHRTNNFGVMTGPTSHDALQPHLQTNEVNSRQSLPILPNITIRQPSGSFTNGANRGVEHDGLVPTRLVPGGHPSELQYKRHGQTQRHINDLPSRFNPPFRKPRQVNIRNTRSSKSDLVHTNKHVADWVDKHVSIEHGLCSARQHNPPQVPDSTQPNFGNTDISQIQAKLLSNMSRRDEAWVDGDPRKYLMNRQRSESENKKRGRKPRKRVKTDRLPLETVPERQDVRNLVLTVVPDTTKLAENWDAMVRDDTFCSTRHTEIDLSDELGLEDMLEVEARLKDLVSVWTEKYLGERFEVNLELRNRVKGKGVSIQPCI